MSALCNASDCVHRRKAAPCRAGCALRAARARAGAVGVLAALTGSACDGGIDESNLDSSWIDTAPPPYVPVEDETLDRFIDVVAVTASVGWAFGDLLDAANRLPTPTAPDRRLVIEGGIESGHLVSETTCVHSLWEGERASLSLAGCALAVSGRPAAGTVALEISDGALRVELRELVVRGKVLEGTITLRSDLSVPTVTRLVEGSVRYADVEAVATTLTFTGSVPIDVFTPLHEPGVTPVLRGTWSSGGGESDFFVQASFVPGDCLPSDGYAVFWGAPFASEMRLGFGLSTPDDHRWGANTLSCP